MFFSRMRRTAFYAPALALTAVTLAVAIALWLPVESLIHLMREGGAIENATAVLFAVAAAALCLGRDRVFRPGLRIAGAIVLGSCVAREVSVRKLLLHTSPGGYCCTPAQTHFVIGVLLVLLVTASAWLIVRYARALLEGVRSGEPAAVSVMTMFACAALSQLLDRVPKLTIALFDHVMSGRARAVALSMEETLEMMLPVFAILAIVQAATRDQA